MLEASTDFDAAQDDRGTGRSGMGTSLQPDLLFVTDDLLLGDGKGLVVVRGVVLGVLDPHPEGERRRAMDAVVPAEIGADGQPNAQHRPRDRLHRGVDAETRVLARIPLHQRTGALVADHQTDFLKFNRLVFQEKK